VLFRISFLQIKPSWFSQSVWQGCGFLSLLRAMSHSLRPAQLHDEMMLIVQFRTSSRCTLLSSLWGRELRNMNIPRDMTHLRGGSLYNVLRCTPQLDSHEFSAHCSTCFCSPFLCLSSTRILAFRCPFPDASTAMTNLTLFKETGNTRRTL
jgi:hypothetical protein